MNFDLSYGCPTARPSYDKSKFLKLLAKIGKFPKKNIAKFAGDLILGPTLSGATQIKHDKIAMFQIRWGCRGTD